MEENKAYKEELIVTKKMFYNEGTNWGAFGFKFKDKVNPSIRIHERYGNFSISGQCPLLTEGESYTIEFEEYYDDKYGDSYRFIKVHSEGIKGKEMHKQFIEELLTEKQAKNIISLYGENDNLVFDILDGKIDLTTVKGIGAMNAENIIKKLSVVHMYSKAIVELSSIGVSIASIRKLVDHFKSEDVVLKYIKEDIYKLTEVEGFGFKRIDDYAQKLGMQLDDARRIKAGAIYVIEQMVSFGDTKIEIDKFDTEMIKILEIEEVDDDLFSKIMSDSRIYYDKGFISLKKYVEEEKSIVYELRRIRDNYKCGVTDSRIEETVIKEEERLGFKFNKEQREAIYKAATNGIMIIDGRAGSGKSASLLTAVKTINLSHAACALSGKASNVLSQYGLEASTIHRLLTVDPKTGKFVYNKENHLNQDIFVLDESSMVNNQIFLQLIESIPDGSQLIIVGDSGQLPAIGRGAIFDYLLKATEFAHTTLVEVHRQALDSGTLEIANMVRDGIQFNSQHEQGVKVYGKNKDFFTFSSQNNNEILPNLLKAVEKYLANPEKNKDDLQIITGLKERGDLSVVNINKLVQPMFNPDNGGDDEFISKKYTYRVGDRVIQQGNNYKAKHYNSIDEFQLDLEGLLDEEPITTEIFNGTFGKIVDAVKGRGILIKFEDVHGYVYYSVEGEKDELAQLDLGYAISCHRSQGSGFHTLFAVITFKEYMLLSRQFLYTMLTRTKEQCFLFNEPKAVQFAVRTDRGKTRKCFIGDYLK